MRGRIAAMSRIVAVAEAYDCMVSDTPYRDAMPGRVARLEITQGVESQFDPNVVAAFDSILALACDDYRSSTRLDFALGDSTGPHVVAAAST
jgi:HD-GYP domain-containing protein (c-di-GMP phosphodiesterase class II)